MTFASLNNNRASPHDYSSAILLHCSNGYRRRGTMGVRGVRGVRGSSALPMRLSPIRSGKVN
ncbi:MAG: hypothetical protein IKC42_01520 [Alistipes sp.]|nr:hypothetical protein [Alistipes sp.]